MGSCMIPLLYYYFAMVAIYWIQQQRSLASNLAWFWNDDFTKDEVMDEHKGVFLFGQGCLGAWLISTLASLIRDYYIRYLEQG